MRIVTLTRHYNMSSNIMDILIITLLFLTTQINFLLHNILCVLAAKCTQSFN